MLRTLLFVGTSTGLLLGLVSSVLAPLAVSQEPAPKMVRTQAPNESAVDAPNDDENLDRQRREVKPENAGPPPRDPTEPRGELRQLLSQPANQPNQPAAPTFPPLRVLAKVIGSKGAVALISVGDKGSLFIEAGATYSLTDFPGADVKVVRIQREGIELEFLPLNRRLLLP